MANAWLEYSTLEREEPIDDTMDFSRDLENEPPGTPVDKQTKKISGKKQEVKESQEIVVSLDECSGKTDVRPQPLRASWLSDFVFVCPDRDILVVKECLVRTSKVFAAHLEDETINSLSLKWGFEAIFGVMINIHVFPTIEIAAPMLTMSADRFKTESGMVEFCFIYEIEPLLSGLKQRMNKQIPSGCCGKWINFFHSFKNQDNTEPFREQIDTLIRSMAITGNNVGLFLTMKYDPIDMLQDYRDLIKKMNDELGVLNRRRKKISISEMCQS